MARLRPRRRPSSSRDHAGAASLAFGDASVGAGVEQFLQGGLVGLLVHRDLGASRPARPARERARRRRGSGCGAPAAQRELGRCGGAGGGCGAAPRARGCGRRARRRPAARARRRAGREAPRRAARPAKVDVAARQFLAEATRSARTTLRPLLVLGEARRVPHVLDREEQHEEHAEQAEGDGEPVHPAAVVALEHVDRVHDGLGAAVPAPHDGAGHGAEAHEQLPRHVHRGGY